eukprot:PhM_4_TR3084/c1_g1_i6/m.53808/K17533/MAP3K19, YSK4; mitogen-activated protein kinase kinase kinase 19
MKLSLRVFPVAFIITALTVVMTLSIVPTAIRTHALIQKTRSTADDSVDSCFASASGEINRINYELMQTLHDSTIVNIDAVLIDVMKSVRRTADLVSLHLERRDSVSGLIPALQPSFNDYLRPILLQDMRSSAATSLRYQNLVGKSLITIAQSSWTVATKNEEIYFFSMEWDGSSVVLRDATYPAVVLCPMTSAATCNTSFSVESSFTYNGTTYTTLNTGYPSYAYGYDPLKTTGVSRDLSPREMVWSVLQSAPNYIFFELSTNVMSSLVSPHPDYGQNVGVVSAAFDVRAFSNFLQVVRDDGETVEDERVYIIDADESSATYGYIMGSSHGETHTDELTLGRGGSIKLTPYPVMAVHSSDEVVSASATWLLDSCCDRLPHDEALTTEFTNSTERYIMRVSRYTTLNLEWLVVVVVPWEDVMGPVEHRQQITKDGIADANSDLDSTLMREQVSLFSSVGFACIIICMMSYLFVQRATSSLIELETDMARVAIMDLESADRSTASSWITEVASMQKSFLAMLGNLKEYRTFMPQAVLLGHENRTASEQLQGSGDSNDTEANKPLTEPALTSVLDAPRSPTTETPVTLFSTRNSVSTASLDEDPTMLTAAANNDRIRSLVDKPFRTFRASIMCVDVSRAVSKQPCLQSLVSAVVEETAATEGVVLSISGDRVVTAWNAFKVCSSHELKATTAAQKLRDILTKFKATAVVGCGRVMVGFVGATAFRSPLVAGDVLSEVKQHITLVSDIEATVVLGEAIAKHVQSYYPLLPVDIVNCRNRRMTLYELIDSTYSGDIDNTAHFREDIALYMIGFSKLLGHDFDGALERFSEFVKKRTPDRIILRHVVRLARLCLYFSKNANRIELPHPYVREHVGWSSYERLSRVESLPAAFSAAEEELMRISMSMDPNDVCPNPMLDTVVPITDAQMLRDSRSAESTPPHSKQSNNNNNPMGGAKHLTVGKTVDEIVTPLGHKYHRSQTSLGRGATSEVFLGMGDNGSLVALKVVAPSHRTRQSVRRDDGEIVHKKVKDPFEKCLSEVNVLSQLRHDNIVAYLGSALQKDNLVIIMEYVSGGSLFSLLQSFGRIPLNSLRHYLRETVHGLHYLHENEIVHCDVKPHNVLLMIDGMCKLTDFGTAGTLQREIDADGTVMLGTPLYMAPEACYGTPTYASDIWSLGVMTAQLLTGAMPYTDDQLGNPFVLSRFLSRLKKDETMVPVFKSDDEDAKDFIRLCVQRDPTKRPTTSMLLAHRFLL